MAVAPTRRYEPLLRNGHLLTVSSLVAAGVGAGYWALAARLHGPEAMGRTFSTVSAVMFLGGVAQLNLANVMVRFVPTAARRTRTLALRGYLASGVAAVLLGGGFVALVPQLASGLDYLHTPLLGVGFVAGTVGFAWFILQDGVLTGLRRADWVVRENVLFAVVKIGVLALLATAGATAGILGSWAVGLLVAITVTNVFIFGRAVPQHAARSPGRSADRSTATPRYLAADWVGSVCWLAADTLPPIIVLDRLGAARSAYFSVAWLIAFALYEFAANMCDSLTVESANDPGQLRRHCRRVLRHAGALLGAAVLVVVVGAPWLLDLFGPGYAREGTGVLRLLALSALPNLLVGVVVAVCRVRRRMVVVAGVLGGLSVLVLGLTVVLLPVLGVVGAGVAWLGSQCLTAAVLVWRRDWWLPEPAAPVHAAREEVPRWPTVRS